MASLLRNGEVNSPLSSAGSTQVLTPIARTSTHVPSTLSNAFNAAMQSLSRTSTDAYKSYNNQTPSSSPRSTGGGTFSFQPFLGGAGGDNGPFSNTRYNLGGQVETISISDPRHTSTSYSDRYPTLYNDFQSGSITGRQLFNGASQRSVQFDTDELANDNFFADYKIGRLPNTKFTFNRSGGGTITGTGISF